MLCFKVFLESDCALFYFSLHKLRDIIFLLNDNSQSKIFISLTMIVMGWLAWASTSLTSLLRRTSSSLEVSNNELLKNKSELEARILERSKQLQEAQAQVLQQEKWQLLDCWQRGSPMRLVTRLHRFFQWCKSFKKRT